MTYVRRCVFLGDKTLNGCIDQKSCGTCLGAGPDCGWCTQEVCPHSTDCRHDYSTLGNTVLVVFIFVIFFSNSIFFQISFFFQISNFCKYQLKKKINFHYFFICFFIFHFIYLSLFLFCIFILLFLPQLFFSSDDKLQRNTNFILLSKTTVIWCRAGLSMLQLRVELCTCHWRY